MNKELEKVDVLYLIGLFFVIVFVPFIPISNSFNLNMEEISILYPLFRILERKKIFSNSFTYISLCFAVYIILTMLFNGEAHILSNYFEVFKIIKFLIIFQFGWFVLYQPEHLKILIKVANIIFFASFFINLLHFFNVFDITHRFLILYDPNSIDITNYGLNSIGQPAAKRIVGTFGNPNENAIFFLLFFAWYSFRISLNRDKSYLLNLFGFFGSSLMVYLTQSRTAFVVLGLILILHFIYNIRHWKTMMLYCSIMIVLFILFYFLDTVSFSYFNNTSIVITHNSSFMGREKVWNLLLHQWMEKPLFGYGPNKTYMYNNNIYPENGYIFFLWRYGIVGLAFYLYVLFYPVFLFGKEIIKHPLFIYIICIFAITALTNVPLFNMKFMFFIALIYSFATLIKQEKVILK